MIGAKREQQTNRLAIGVSEVRRIVTGGYTPARPGCYLSPELLQLS